MSTAFKDVRDLHVVAKLEVRSEQESLRHCDVSPSFEHHHSNWFARKSVADDEFGNDIETNLLVRHSLNNSYRKDVEESNALSRASAWRLPRDSGQLTSAKTNAQTGICVFHTSIVTTPNTNMATRAQ